MPGYLLQVDCDGEPVPAALRSITLNLQSETGQAAPTLVEAAVSSDQPSTWLAGTASHQNLRWIWTLTLPGDLTHQRVGLRVTDADGNTAESGMEDFSRKNNGSYRVSASYRALSG